MKTLVRLVGIPLGTALGGVDIARLIHRVERSELVMSKGVLTEDESHRYMIACERLEYLVAELADEGQVESCQLGPEYFDLVEKIAQKDSEKCDKAMLFCSHCSVEMMGNRVNEFEKLMIDFGLNKNNEMMAKIGFYRKAMKQGWCVVELQETTFDDPDSGETIDEGELRSNFLSLAVSDDVHSTAESASSGLKRQVWTVIKSLGTTNQLSLNFSEQSHIAIAEVMNEFVFMKGKRVDLPVQYGDGSIARPFPVFCLSNRSGAIAHSLLKDEKTLRVAMISARHDNDGLGKSVALSWFLNVEMSSGKAASEIDELAYQQSKELLTKMRAEGFYRIEFYQTGFQPVVVGFYRALVEDLLSGQHAQPRYEIKPMFYFVDKATMKGDFRVGRVWA